MLKRTISITLTISTVISQFIPLAVNAQSRSSRYGSVTKTSLQRELKQINAENSEIARQVALAARDVCLKYYGTEIAKQCGIQAAGLNRAYYTIFINDGILNPSTADMKRAASLLRNSPCNNALHNYPQLCNVINEQVIRSYRQQMQLAQPFYKKLVAYNRRQHAGRVIGAIGLAALVAELLGSSPSDGYGASNESDYERIERENQERRRNIEQWNQR